MDFLDTNVLLDLQEEDYSKEFMISSVTLNEIDNLAKSSRRNEELHSKVMRTIELLNKYYNGYNIVTYDTQVKEILIKKGLMENTDNMICACAEYIHAYGVPVLFITNNVIRRHVAGEIFNIPHKRYSRHADNIYTGYKVISGTTSEINEQMANINIDDWYANEYIVIENKDDGTTKEMRFDGNGFVQLKLPPSKYIKGQNSLQRCALDMLNNQDITVAAVLGGYGSGKTFLSMQMALYNVKERGNQAKILGVREVSGEGKEVGYLPGEVDDKTGQFFTPLIQQLDGGEYELKSLRDRGMIETNIPYFMKGTTYNETIMVVDEAEDLTESQIRLIGTRIGKNSRIFLDGDYKQSLLQKTVDNPLIKMCNAFKGNPSFACIYLGEDVRSSTSKMFADLFTKDS